MLLASIISEKQDTAAYLQVFAIALRNYGAPEAIVTDGGGIFYSTRALAIYEALNIRKERDPGKPWQNYIEAHFGIMRRIWKLLPQQCNTLGGNHASTPQVCGRLQCPGSLRTSRTPGQPS